MKRGWLFWIFWGVDALIAAVTVYFFFRGLADGSITIFNIALWLGVLAGLVGILGGSLRLRTKGHARWAMGLVLFLAIPGILTVLLFFAAVMLQPRWN